MALARAALVPLLAAATFGAVRADDGDRLVDCADPDCINSPSCVPPVEECTNRVDDDGDRRVDCADADCAGDPGCFAVVEECTNRMDDDADGLVDCADPDCGASPSCAPPATEGFDLVLSAEGAVAEEDAQALDLEYEEETTVPVTVWIVPDPDPQPEGAQGWSPSVAHDEDAMEIDPESPPTIEGTDAGNLMSGGFEKTEVADAGQGGGVRGAGADGRGAGEGGGFVSAVVLSLTQPIVLDPTRAQSIARAGYRVRDGLGKDRPGTATVRFEDALQGSGQPVRNAITISGCAVKPLKLVPLEVRRVTSGTAFVRGDPNSDGNVNIADAIWCISELVRQGPPTQCRRAADANADGLYDLSDAAYIIECAFRGGPTIPEPFPRCGVATAPIDLDCPPGSVSHCP